MISLNLGRLIWNNALRNKRRTGLTVLSIGFSLFLLMALLTFMDALFHPSSQAEAAARLIVTRSTAVLDMMPLAYLDKIRQVPNVQYAAPLQWCNAMYKEPKYQFANFATDPRYIWSIYTEARISPQAKAAFIADRRGAVAGKDLVDQFGWHIGDHITLIGTIFPVDLEVTIVGTFEAPAYQNMLYFRNDYLEESLGNPGMLGAIAVRAKSPAVAPEVAQTIDKMFRNSPAETKTASEKAFVLGFVAMLGNIQLIIGSVASVAVFTMLLVSISTMAMTVRERLREVAILKAVGYPRNAVLFMVVAEAVLVSMMGVALGIGVGELLRFADLENTTEGFITGYHPTLLMYALTVGTGALIGLISGFIPAWQAANMTVMGAMRRLD